MSHDNTTNNPPPDEKRERRMLRLLSDILIKKMEEYPDEMSAAEMETVRKLSQDAGITLADIDTEEFGDVVAEAERRLRHNQVGGAGLPFDQKGRPVD